jgi:NADH dehydrogenase [ubiquinone] 1 alpha subcomplex assembly factor 6
MPGLWPIAALLRRHDRDRYQTALFAPPARRAGLFAIYAFNYEIARVRDRVSEPILGRIRLEWWRENIADIFAGGPVRRHEIVAALAETVRRRPLSRAHFERLIAAREADLEAPPPATLAALEDYAEASSASLVYLALEALGAPGAAVAAAREVGIAYALAGLIRALPLHARAGRRYIPDDIAARAGLAPRDYQRLQSTPALRAAVGDIAAAAQRRLQAARERRPAVPRAAHAALLPAVVAGRVLARLGRAGCDPYAPALRAADPLQIWALGLAALSRRY